MNTTFQKKGAVEMSLNLIIMLVIGLTLMGLVIGFVTSFLGNAEDTFSSKLSEDDKTKVDEVKREAGNFAFLSSSVKTVQGDKAGSKIYMKVRNPYNDQFSHNGGDVLTTSSAITAEIQEGKIDVQGSIPDIIIQSPPITLNTGESDGYALSVYAGSTTSLGTYYATFKISYQGGVVETKVLTITVE